MNIGIFGLPNGGKSQFRRWLVQKLRKAGVKVEHWDADRFKKSRVPEDNDMREPTDEPGIIWLVEDVRGTVPHKETVAPGEKEGAWKSLSYYDFIFYLLPDWPTYAAFWVSRALQWKQMGAGNWMRESGWEDMTDDDVIIRKAQYFFEGREGWEKGDKRLLSSLVLIPHTIVRPVYTGGQIEWRDFDFEKFLFCLSR